MNVSKTASLHRERNCSLKLYGCSKKFEISTSENKVSSVSDLIRNTPTGKIPDLDFPSGGLDTNVSSDLDKFCPLSHLTTEQKCGIIILGELLWKKR